MTRKCLKCKKRFEPKNGNQVVCSFECARDKAKADREKKESIEWKKEKKRLKESVARLTDYRKRAREWFQRWIRIRDLGKSCISCPTVLKDIREYDAGHYLSAHLHSSMMFDEVGTNGQCVYCNHRLSGSPVEYRKGLISRYGVAEVERLEGAEKSKKWTKEDYLKVETEYKERCKLLKDRA